MHCVCHMLSAACDTAVDGLVRAVSSCVRDPVGHAWLSCVPPPGVGRLHQWTVTVGGQASAPSTDTTSYAVPVLKSVSGDNFNTDGGQVVVLNGLEFGPQSATANVSNDNLIVVRYGPLVSARCVCACVGGKRWGRGWPWKSASARVGAGRSGKFNRVCFPRPCLGFPVEHKPVPGNELHGRVRHTVVVADEV